MAATCAMVVAQRAASSDVAAAMALGSGGGGRNGEGSGGGARAAQGVVWGGGRELAGERGVHDRSQRERRREQRR